MIFFFPDKKCLFASLFLVTFSMFKPVLLKQNKKQAKIALFNKYGATEGNHLKSFFTRKQH